MVCAPCRPRIGRQRRREKTTSESERAPRASIDTYSALRLPAEIGTDMTRWPTEKHFTSWLTLAPHNKISGGRLLSAKTQQSANRAATILRMAAMNLGRTDTALGAFYRRLAYRVGKAKAITATARKLAIRRASRCASFLGGAVQHGAPALAPPSTYHPSGLAPTRTLGADLPAAPAD
jgi:Transposase IS116/IS110/IS902 family